MKRTILIFIIYSIALCSFSQKHIVIDPGHNFDDIASNYRTDTEVLTNWAVANKFISFVANDNDPSTDWIIHNTRPNNDPGTNNQVGISEREEKAISYEEAFPGEVYFLSVHCNGSTDPNSSGTETFYCDETFKNTSLNIAYGNSIQNNTVSYGSWNDRNRMMECGDYNQFDCIGKDGKLHLCVLDELTMPNLLNEIAFVTNAADKAKLLSDDWRDKIAWGYLEGFKAAFADLEVVSLNLVNMPSATSTYCKISVGISNKTEYTFNGEIRALLKDFPANENETPSVLFSQLGTNQSVTLAAGQTTTIMFEGHLPVTIAVGKALCLDSKNIDETVWKKVPRPEHNRIIKFPLNAALINGVVYDQQYKPLPGVRVWSYKSSTGTSINQSAGSDLKSTNSIAYDPTSCYVDGNGYYEILVPTSWSSAEIAVYNNSDYMPIVLNPIESSYQGLYYYVAPPPPPPETCYDGKLNQDETTTDCGGVCPSCGIGGNLKNVVESAGSYPDLSSTTHLLKLTNKSGIYLIDGQKSHGNAGILTSVPNGEYCTATWKDFNGQTDTYQQKLRCPQVVSICAECKDYAEKDIYLKGFNSGVFFDLGSKFFSPFKTYLLTFYLGIGENINVNFALTNNLQSGNSGSKPTPSNYYLGYLNKEYIYGYKKFRFTPPTEAYNQLWLYSTCSLNNVDPNWLYNHMHAISITEECVEYLVINTQVQGDIEATKSIEISNQIITVKNSLTLRASESIAISKPFVVKSGGYFHASLSSDVCILNELKSAESSESTNSIPNYSEKEQFDFDIVPNPAKRQFTIQIIGDYNTMQQIDIYNQIGQRVFFQTIGFDREYIIDAIDWNSGIYIIRIMNNKGIISTRKLLKE